MRSRELYATVISSEKAAYEYLQRKGIFSFEMACPGFKGSACGHLMSMDYTRFRWRCRKRCCGKQLSMRGENKFFCFEEETGRLHSRLSIYAILELVWYFIYSRQTTREVAYQTDHDLHTISDWFNLMREVCSHSVEAEPKYIETTSEPVQIDESFFSGRRKYNRGRLLKGNLNASDTNSNNNELPDWNEEPENESVYGIDDPTWCWVLGIYQNKNDVRFFRVRDRSGATLVPTIQKYVEPGSVIVTDLWGGYNTLGQHGFIHETVNHSLNYVNPVTGYHTQGIERSWRTAKEYLGFCLHHRQLLQSHSDEASWKMKQGNNLATYWPAFFDDIKTFYS